MIIILFFSNKNKSKLIGCRQLISLLISRSWINVGGQWHKHSARWWKKIYKRIFSLYLNFAQPIIILSLWPTIWQNPKMSQSHCHIIVRWRYRIVPKWYSSVCREKVIFCHDTYYCDDKWQRYRWFFKWIFEIIITFRLFGIVLHFFGNFFGKDSFCRN